MDNYEDTIKTGDHAPNLIVGDLMCNTMQMLNRVEGLEAGSPMPPTKALPPDLVEIYKQWILAGMPNTVADAEAAVKNPTPTSEGPELVSSPTPVPESIDDTHTPPPLPEVTPAP